ncbi:MAG: sporulation protein YqfD [Peptococcaceae bacterium]|nr:MAG: sporulation protein YqfD [Peptococcaceae bacterium]
MPYFTGYVTIEVTGESPEKFINMAVNRGIYLWEITKAGGNIIRVKVYLREVRLLRHVARGTGYRFHFIERCGLPFAFSRLRRRKMMIIGAFLFLAGLYFLASFVWFIEVKGNVRLSSQEVLEIAARAGLIRGVQKWRVNTAGVESLLQEQLPLVAWTGVYLKGTKATIEIAERVLPEAEDQRPVHVVAAKTGLVKEILVLRGHPAVKEGDTVMPGQVLISGVIPPPETPEKDKKKKAEPLRYVHAGGIVRARVWYEGYGEAALVETGRRPSGKSITWICMKIGGKEIIILGSGENPFTYYYVETDVKRLPSWRNLSVPVEFNKVKYLELVDYRVDRGYDSARRLALEKAMEAVRKQLPDGARVLEQRVQEVRAGCPKNLARVKVLLETVEDIGAEEPFKP